MHECDACGLIFGGTEGCPSCGSMVSHAAPEEAGGGQEKPAGPLPGGVQLQESMEGIDGLETLASKASSEGTDLPFQLGGSSGGVVWAALQTAKKLNKGDKCLVILPDSIRNYLSKFVDDKWMEEQGFLKTS